MHCPQKKLTKNAVKYECSNFGNFFLTTLKKGQYFLARLRYFCSQEKKKAAHTHKPQINKKFLRGLVVVVIIFKT